MKTIFRIFFHAEGTRPFLVLFCLLLAGAAEVLSIGTLLPLAASLAGDSVHANSALGGLAARAIAWLGIGHDIGSLVMFMAAFMALKAILSFAALSYAGIEASGVAITMRRRLINGVFAARWAFYTGQKSGRLANALSQEASRAGDAYMLAARMFASFMQALVYALVAFAVDWRLATASFAVGLAVAAVFAKLVTISRGAGRTQMRMTRKLSALIVDVTANIKALKSMSRYHRLAEKMNTMLRNMRRALIIQHLSTNGMAQGSEFLVTLLVGAGIYVASTVWHAALAELVIAGIAFYQILSATSRLQRFFQQAVTTENSYLRLEEMILTAEAEREGEGGSVVADPDAGLELRGVSFGHGQRRILDNVSIAIPPRKITVLQGPSGAGKTTIIDLLTGLHKAQAGAVLIGGVPMADVNLPAWRSQIGYVAQELILLHTTIRDNITLADPDISDDTIWTILDRVGATDFIRDSDLGLDGVVGELGSKLSGGQRQRIAIARALVSGPKVLILDEVTSALDPETERQIVDKIATLRDHYTIIVITHRPAWTAIADKLYQVDGGRAVEQKVPEAPLRKTGPRRRVKVAG